MAENLDPESIRQFNESMRELNNVMPALITGLGQLSGVASGSTKVQDALNKHANAVKGMTELDQSNIDAQKKKAAADANRASADASAVAALKDFTSAMMNTSTEFSKFNGTLGNAGDAALALGKNFGAVGLIIGGLIKGATKVAQLATVQADNALKVTDEFNKMGSAGAFTAKQMAEMSISIGLSNEQWNLLPKALRKAGDGIVGLGTTTAKGQESFAKLLAVTNSEREAFQRLGISQEELMGKQAEYIALQGMSGKSLVTQAKDADKLRKSSLEYTENLLRLSALTGKDADKIAKDQQLANMQYEEVIRTRVEDDKIRKLTQEGRTAEAESLQDEQKARKQFITDATSRFGEETGLQLAKVARTGAYDESTKGIAQLGIDATELAAKLKKAKPGEEVADLFNNTAETVKTRVSEKLGNFETSLQFGGEELGKTLGLNKELILNTGRVVERNEKEADAAAKRGIAKPSEGKTGETTTEDPAQKARNAVTTTTIEFNKALERGLVAVNPLLSGFNSLTLAVTGLTAAAIAAAAALAAIGAKKAIGSVLGTETMPDSDGGKGKGKGKPSVLKRVGGGVAGAVAGYTLGKGAEYANEKGYEKTGTALDIASSGATGAGMGAMLGPVGAAVGGALGVGYGVYQNREKLFGGAPASSTPASSTPASSTPATGTQSKPATAKSAQPPQSSGSDGAGVDPAQKAQGSGSSDVKLGMLRSTKGNAGMSEEEIKQMIIKHEGKINRPYKDSLGLWTVGVGHLIGDGKSLPPEMNREFSDEEVMAMFEKDYAHHRSAAMNIPGFDKLNGKGQGALTDLTFNMGPSWISKWPKLKKQLEEGDTEAAAKNLEQSKWYGQVGNRAPTIVSLIKDSKVSANLEGIAQGPESGYNATLHGTEIIKRLTKDSILDKLANTPAGDMFSNSAGGNVDNSELVGLMKEFVEKMDDLLVAQTDSNSIQSELLMYSKV
jgi:GH24 family phage-related lysozyme (muramidase)